jgi:hypothetical protein
MGGSAMRKSIRLSLLVLFAILVAACAEVQVKPIAGAENVVIEAPAYKVGDEWRYPGGYYIRVVAFEGDNVVAESNLDPYCRGCRFVRDRNGTPIRVFDAQGRPVEYALTGLKLLDFPLRVGKEWTQEIQLRVLATGTMRPYFNRFKVEAYEEVVTKAGTFKAFRISWHQENRAPGSSWSGRLDMWWSPEAKGFVKRTVYATDWVRDFEIESYTLK